MTDTVYEGILEPLHKHYGDTKTVEIRINRPEKVVVDRRGAGKSEVDAPDLSLGAIEGICRSISKVNGLDFDPEMNPVLSCALPGGHRFQCAVGKSIQDEVSLAIRCKHPYTPSWDDIGVSKGVQEYLEGIVMSSRNILFSGATNTGKTTLLNMMLEFLPDERRVVGIEDTPELKLDRFWDGVGLIAARHERPGSGLLTWRQHYDHCMRITPDHIIFGEISTENAFAALGALNSGITGFMCTIHAESPEQAMTRKFEQNIAWSGQDMPRVPEFLNELIDVVIQIKRRPDGFRRITDIYQPRDGRWVMKNGEDKDLRESER